jgi:hypothetical protein
MSIEVSATADTAAGEPVTCVARAACWRCAAVSQVSGVGAGTVLRALQAVLAEEGWRTTLGGLRVCPACSRREDVA